MRTGICKLCLQEKPLLRRSHIIPEFIYKHGELYHDNHTLKKIDFRSINTGKIENIGKLRLGEYEGNILCDQCEKNILQPLEDYSKRMLYDGPNKIEEARDKIIVHDIDYKKVKLFFLSVLWRSAISTRPSFSLINPSQKLTESLREMIITGDPGTADIFPVTLILDIGKYKKQYMTQPVTTKDGTGFLFVLPGFLFLIFKDNQSKPGQLLRYNIEENGSIVAMGVKPEKIWDLFFHLYG